MDAKGHARFTLNEASVFGRTRPNYLYCKGVNPIGCREFVSCGKDVGQSQGNFLFDMLGVLCKKDKVKTCLTRDVNECKYTYFGI